LTPSVSETISDYVVAAPAGYLVLKIGTDGAT
jgi:hypothetical protein